jgi:hypothetical protein
MIRKILLALLVMGLGTLLGVAGCGKSDSSSTADAGGNGAANSGSPLEKEARNAAMAEVQKHWVKNGEGWVTARISGSAYAPDHFLRQVKQIETDEVTSDQPSDADKLNGVEWSGVVSFKKLACREAGDTGMLLDGLGDTNATRQHGQWTPWSEYLPENMRLVKVKGQWQVNEDTWLLRGTIPTADDYAKAGVK